MSFFIIIGAQKCGTTSLYNYLIQHPQIVSAVTKEVHFFDLNYNKGGDWYLEQFPGLLDSPQNSILGEASPYYIFHPLVPQRVWEMLPQAKLIVMLRNPIDRTISHYYHEVRLGYEQLSLADAIACESTRLQEETQKLLSGEINTSFNHQHYSYLSRGIYIDQIKNWMAFFPKEQFLILESAEFYTNPAAIFNQVLDFLELPSYHLADYGKYNTGDYPAIDETAHQYLKTYFQPYNQKLEEYLGRNFDWK